jgi:hypothetical protein
MLPGRSSHSNIQLWPSLPSLPYAGYIPWINKDGRPYIYVFQSSTIQGAALSNTPSQGGMEKTILSYSKLKRNHVKLFAMYYINIAYITPLKK